MIALSCFVCLHAYFAFFRAGFFVTIFSNNYRLDSPFKPRYRNYYSNNFHGEVIKKIGDNNRNKIWLVSGNLPKFGEDLTRQSQLNTSLDNNFFSIDLI